MNVGVWLRNLFQERKTRASDIISLSAPVNAKLRLGVLEILSSSKLFAEHINMTSFPIEDIYEDLVDYFGPTSSATRWQYITSLFSRDLNEKEFVFLISLALKKLTEYYESTKEREIKVLANRASLREKFGQTFDSVIAKPVSTEIGNKNPPERTVKRINSIFARFQFPYKYSLDLGQLLYLHNSYPDITVEETLYLLKELEFFGAEDEFRVAIDHYHNGRLKEAIISANSSLESVLKVVVNKLDPGRFADFKKEPGCADMVNACLEYGIIRGLDKENINKISSLIVSLSPANRNRLGAHGQGEIVLNIQPYLAKYVVNVTAASILLIVNAYKDHVNRM